MMLIEPLTDSVLLDRGLALLADLLGPSLILDDFDVSDPSPANLTTPLLDLGATRLMSVHEAPAAGMSAPILVQARSVVSPASLHRQVLPQVELMRRLNGDAAVLVVSAWLSPRTRAALDELSYNYVDLTGNVSFRLARPRVVLRTEGDKRGSTTNPNTERRLLRGPKAGRLVRALVDVAPTYGATNLARATGLSAPYVSRLLDTLENQSLISRSGRQITSVDWRGLLRARAESYELLKPNNVAAFIAPQGTSIAMQRLATLASGCRVAVTGPLAAQSVAPIAIGGQLMIYVERESIDADHLRKDLGLLTSISAADVLFLVADDPVVFSGTRLVDGVPHVSLSQLAIDSFGGPGRMPAEGEQLLTFMAAHLGRWQKTSLTEWAVDYGKGATES